MNKQEWLEYFELTNNRKPTKEEIESAIYRKEITLEEEKEVRDVAKEVLFSRENGSIEKLSYTYGLGYAKFFDILNYIFTFVNIGFSIYFLTKIAFLGVIGIILGVIFFFVADFSIKIYRNLAIMARTNTDIRNKLYGVDD